MKFGLAATLVAALVTVANGENDEDQDDYHRSPGFMFTVGGQPPKPELQHILVTPNQGQANISGSFALSFNGQETTMFFHPTSMELQNELMMLPGIPYVFVHTLMASPQEYLYEVEFASEAGNVDTIACVGQDVMCEVTTTQQGGNPMFGDLVFTFNEGENFSLDFNATEYDLEMQLQTFPFADHAKVERWNNQIHLYDGTQVTHSYRVYGVGQVPQIEASGNFQVLHVDWAGEGVPLNLSGSIYPYANTSDISTSSSGKVLVESGSMTQVFYKDGVAVGYYNMELELMDCIDSAIAGYYVACIPMNGTEIVIFDGPEVIANIPLQVGAPPLAMEMYVGHNNRIIVVTAAEIVVLSWYDGLAFHEPANAIDTFPLFENDPEQFSGGVDVTEFYAAVTTNKSVFVMNFHDGSVYRAMVPGFAQTFVTREGRVYVASAKEVGIQNIALLIIEPTPQGWMEMDVPVPPELMMNPAPFAKLFGGKDFIVLGDCLMSEVHDDENNHTFWAPMGKLRAEAFLPDGLTAFYDGEKDDETRIVLSGLDLRSGMRVINIFYSHHNDHHDEYKNHRWTWACSCDFSYRSYEDCLQECEMARGRWGWTCADERLRKLSDLSEAESNEMYNQCHV